MIFKIVGSATVLLCGVLYARHAQKGVCAELAEVERLVGIFKYLRNEIEEFDTPLYSILKTQGIEGGIEGLLSTVECEKLRAAVSDAEKLGRGYKKEELRICDRLVSRLENEKKSLEIKVRETKVMSRVKGLGTAAAAVILLL